jgi:hypothetical protein
MNGVRAIIAVVFVLWSTSAWGATLTWTMNGESDLAGYRVYQCSQLPCTLSSGRATLLTTLGKVTSFNIGTPAVVQYYVITAHDFTNRESLPSNLATYVPAGTRQIPTAPTVPGSMKVGKWVTAWGQNRLDIFGIGTDGAMYYKAWTGSAWQPSVLGWQRLGGDFISPPAVMAWGENRLDLFGLGTDGAMYYKAWTGSAWQPSVLEWQRLGGDFTSPPAVTAWGENRLDLFGLGTDGAMYHKAWNDSAWWPSVLAWERLGGDFTSPPAVTAWGQNRLDIFGIGTDGAMYYKAWTGSAWQPSVLEWQRLGGAFTAP